MFSLENVSVRLNGVTILQDITWQVRRGENWALLGPNGCGKTSLIQVIRGNLPRLLILDEPLQGLDPANRRRITGLIDLIASHLPVQILYVTHFTAELPACITHRLSLPAGERSGPGCR